MWPFALPLAVFCRIKDGFLCCKRPPFAWRLAVGLHVLRNMLVFIRLCRNGKTACRESRTAMVWRGNHACIYCQRLADFQSARRWLMCPVTVVWRRCALLSLRHFDALTGFSPFAVSLVGLPSCYFTANFLTHVPLFVVTFTM